MLRTVQAGDSGECTAHLPSLHPSAHGNESHAGLEQDKENLFRFLALAGSVDADMEY